MRERDDEIAPLMTHGAGQDAGRSQGRELAAADVIDWFAEEARRAYGRVIPARGPASTRSSSRSRSARSRPSRRGISRSTRSVRKLSAALAAGCSIIVKAPEETPASPARLIRAFADAGVPAGVVNLVFGVPAEISEYLIPHPVIRKISFTGSTAVGKQLAALAGLHMKRATMELGGHAPAIVFDDADVDVGREDPGGGEVPQCRPGLHLADALPGAGRASTTSSSTSSSRRAKAIKVGDGLDAGHDDGPARQSAPRHRHGRAIVQDAVGKGAQARRPAASASATRATSSSRPCSPTCRWMHAS